MVVIKLQYALFYMHWWVCSNQIAILCDCFFPCNVNAGEIKTAKSKFWSAVCKYLVDLDELIQAYTLRNFATPFVIQF